VSKCRGDFDLYTSDAVIAEASAGVIRRLLPSVEGVRRNCATLCERTVDGTGAEVATALALPARARLDACMLPLRLCWNGFSTDLELPPLGQRRTGCLRLIDLVLMLDSSAPRILTPELLLESP